MSVFRDIAADMRAVLALAAVVTCAGCASVQINVTASSEVNGGRPVHMLVRAVEPKAFLTEGYQAIARNVITADDKVLASTVIYPGTRREVTVPKPAARLSVAVYFLFTAPGEPWKRLLEPPLPSKVELKLEEDRIVPPPRR